jgi:glycosyltransferase involved in cell wall biosynthesis
LKKVITVVIPTYNRNEQLNEVLNCILTNNTEGVDDIEIIVVDDESPVSVDNTIKTTKIVYPFSLKVIRQINSGPAVARNNGFKNAEHEIVLFIDDDVLIEEDTIKKHIEAHQIHQGSIIIGSYPYKKPLNNTPIYRFLSKSILDGLNMQVSNRFIQLNTIASGNLSVEKKIFKKGYVYDHNMQTPAAEEYELIHRLISNKVPIYLDKDIKSWHLQPITLEDKCKQEYKYGMGTIEAIMKKKEVLELPAVKSLYETNFLNSDLKSKIRVVLATKFFNSTLKAITSILEKIFPIDVILFSLYRLIIGNYFYRGMQDGFHKFKNTEGVSDSMPSLHSI